MTEQGEAIDSLETELSGKGIVQLLSEVSREVGAVRKDSRNQSQNFNFRGIDAVVNATHRAFGDRGIVAIPKVVERDAREVTTSSGKRQVWILLTVEYTFYAPGHGGDGFSNSLTAVVVSEATDFADKATAKAMSVAYRTALLQVLHLPTDDPDPDASYEPRSDGEPVKKAAVKKAAPKVVGDALAPVEDVRELIKSAALLKGRKPAEVKQWFTDKGFEGLMDDGVSQTVLDEALKWSKGEV